MAGPSVSTTNAKDVLAQLLAAQRSGQYVEWRCWASRSHVTGYADPTTGTVANANIPLFSRVQGEQGQGFARALSAADTVLRSGEAQVPGGTEFVAFALGLWVAPEAPPWVSETLLYYGTLTQQRHNTVYNFGQSALWPSGEYGIQARAAATAQAGVTINQRTNGAIPCRKLAENALIALPTRQPLDFTWATYRAFNATTDGNPLGGGNALIDNTGQPVNGTTINQYVREICGTFGIQLWGYQFSLPG